MRRRTAIPSTTRPVLLFIQVINHGIEHRTNITTILSGLGLPAPEVDGWGYIWIAPGSV